MEKEEAKKIVVLGDIHGRKIWKEIIEKEKPDLVIFMGDYITTHDYIEEKEQIANLDEILDYKEQNPDKVILLRGNHDVQHMGKIRSPQEFIDEQMKKRGCDRDFDFNDVTRWSGYSKWLEKQMLERYDRFCRDSQWAYIHDIDGKPYIFSHAGISKDWLHDTAHLDPSDPDWLKKLNEMPVSNAFSFIQGNHRDWDGSSSAQPPTWIRPQVLAECKLPGYSFVVGHSPCKKGCINMRTTPLDEWPIKPEYGGYKEYPGGDADIWLTDALGNGSYLVIEDNKIEPHDIPLPPTPKNMGGG
ncbi:MAG: metallophosphoesterase [Bacteroidales bacterium]|nr:metallophosphoesterase [Bacteroidales bacterium]